MSKRGGKRPGAGRPAGTAATTPRIGDTKITIYVPGIMRDEVELAAGRRNVSAWMRSAILRKLGPEARARVEAALSGVTGDRGES